MTERERESECAVEGGCKVSEENDQCQYRLSWLAVVSTGTSARALSLLPSSSSLPSFRSRHS